MKQVHWMHGNSFGHSLEPGVFQLGYQASRDYLVTRQNSLEFDTPAAFDQLLHVRSVDSLREHLCTRLYEMEQGIVFNDMVSKLANNTNATADMIKEALHAPSMKGKSWPSHKAEATAGRGFPLLPTTVLCSSRRDFASHSLCMSHWPTIREVNVNTAMQGSEKWVRTLVSNGLITPSTLGGDVSRCPPLAIIAMPMLGQSGWESTFGDHIQSGGSSVMLIGKSR